MVINTTNRQEKIFAIIVNESREIQFFIRYLKTNPIVHPPLGGLIPPPLLYQQVVFISYVLRDASKLHQLSGPEFRLRLPMKPSRPAKKHFNLLRIEVTRQYHSINYFTTATTSSKLL